MSDTLLVILSGRFRHQATAIFFKSWSKFLAIKSLQSRRGNRSDTVANNMISRTSTSLKQGKVLPQYNKRVKCTKAYAKKQWNISTNKSEPLLLDF